MFQIGGDLHVLAAIDRADVLHAPDLLGKANAAGALDAAGHRRLDDGSHVFLGHGPLVLVKAGVAASIGKRLVLKVAFSALVADRTIERVVDEEELNYPFPQIGRASCREIVCTYVLISVVGASYTKK